MGLQATIQNAVASVKTATLDLWSDVTYKVTAPSSYNTSTGAVTSTSTSTSIKVLLESFSENQIDGHAIKATDLKATFLQDDLSGTPDVNDLVTYLSKDWSVVNVKQDSANATWEVQLRVSS